MPKKFVLFLSILFLFLSIPYWGNVKAENSNEIVFSSTSSIPKMDKFDNDLEWTNISNVCTININDTTAPLIHNGIIKCYVDDKIIENFNKVFYMYSGSITVGIIDEVTSNRSYYHYGIATEQNGYDYAESKAFSDVAGSSISHILKFTCSDPNFNINDFVHPVTMTSKEFNNFEFTGYVFSPNTYNTDSPLNGYGLDLTIGFNIPCDYSGLDGVIFGKNSIIKDELIEKIKNTSVVLWNGKKLNIPKNKISMHFYEPTPYENATTKEKYGYYQLSNKDPYDLWKNGDGRLRGTIIVHTGNVPQENGDITIEYKSSFIDSCVSEYFSFKGYKFSSSVYSCSQNIVQQAVVDNNNDGVDDNTGLHIGSKYDNNGNHTVTGQTVDDEPNRSDYDDGILGLVEYIGDLIVYWIKAPFISIANGFTILINSANSCFEWFGNFGDFFNNFFSFLPSPIQTCAIAIISATTVSIILAMFFKR